MSKAKVTIKRGIRAIQNSASIQVTVPATMRKVARIKAKDVLIAFQYEGPTVETGLFSIRSGDVVIRKDEPILV